MTVETFHAGPNLGRLSDVTVIHGDCIEAMAELADNSVDAIVCDPPYGLGFMGKAWDELPPGLDWAKQCYRVLKPGGHLLAFGGTRTWHRLAVAVEDAGFEIRDSIAWLYGSGFPKSRDIGKAIDTEAGATREVVGSRKVQGGNATRHEGWQRPWMDDPEAMARYGQVTAPATPEAAQWQGWGTAMKPGWEGAVTAQKPLQNKDRIGSRLDDLEDQCRHCARPAEPSSKPIQVGSHEAKTGSALGSAATQLAGAREALTATGAAEGSSDQTGTRWSEWTATTSLNIVTSWKRLWVEVSQPVSMSTTSTASETTIDLRTLWSCLSKITDASTHLTDPTSPDGLSSLARIADNLFAAAWLNWNSTRELTATEPATSQTPPTSQRAGGSLEPIVVGRKPLAAGTVAANVLTYGTGALNIDGCRIDTNGETWPGNKANAHTDYSGKVLGKFAEQYAKPSNPGGRWPANVILDEDQAAALDEQSGTFKGRVGMTQHGSGTNAVYGKFDRTSMSTGNGGTEDSGGASRFFFNAGPSDPPFLYCAKAPKKERPVVIDADGKSHSHATVKPLALMRWLVRLVTPPGGVVLDPFAGSGTTIEAAMIEGFHVIGIEREADYLPMIQLRIRRALGFDS